MSNHNRKARRTCPVTIYLTPEQRDALWQWSRRCHEPMGQCLYAHVAPLLDRLYTADMPTSPNPPTAHKD